MLIAHCLSSVALCSIMGGDGSESLIRLLGDQFSDKSRKLTDALQKANERAWQALEIALAGDGRAGWFERVSDRSLRDQVRAYLAQVSLPELSDRDDFRRECLKDLRQARAKGLLLGRLVAGEVAASVGEFARYADTAAILRHEQDTGRQMADILRKEGFASLSWLLEQQAQPGKSVVMVAMRFYFRLAVQGHRELAREVQFARLEGLTEQQEKGFAALEQALAANAEAIQAALDEVLVVSEQARDAAAAARDAVLDLQAEARQMHGAGQAQMQTMASQMQQLLDRFEMAREPLRPGHSLSIRNDRERQMVKELLAQYRRLPEPQREHSPALLNGMGQLLVGVGQFKEAEKLFEKAADAARTDPARAEAHHNAYRAALEAEDYPTALNELNRACALDGARFSPFPLTKYEPRRILGAGGFGVTFLCKHREYGGQIAIKSLNLDGLDRDGRTVLQEARTLDELRHPSIIALKDCDFADAAKTRPFLAMEFFDGPTLEKWVADCGPLRVEDALAVARKVAEAMKAAHARGVLHRDIKPANLLVRLGDDGWDVRVIDFGLALKQRVLKETMAASRGQSILGTAVAGTLGYAAPEQLGQSQAKVGPAADVYGFGRTLAFMLFGHAEATFQDYQKLPPALAQLLGRCVAHNATERPADFAEVLRELDSGKRTAKASTPAPAARELNYEVVEIDDLGVEELDPAPARAKAPPPLGRRHAHLLPSRSEHPTTTTLKRIMDAVLAVCLSWLGAHKFSQGNGNAGMLRVLLNFTCFGLFINPLIGTFEALLYLVKSNEEYDRVYLEEKRFWF